MSTPMSTAMPGSVASVLVAGGRPGHLAEYVSPDTELGFITDHRDMLAVLR